MMSGKAVGPDDTMVAGQTSQGKVAEAFEQVVQQDLK